jgi:hypothetical protein
MEDGRLTRAVKGSLGRSSYFKRFGERALIWRRENKRSWKDHLYIFDSWLLDG